MSFIMIAWFYTGPSWFTNPVVATFKTNSACELVLKEMKTATRYSNGKCIKLEESK